MKWIILVFVVGLSCAVFGQGTFQNLNFEQANPIAVPNGQYYNEVTAASALPYWSVTTYGVQQTDMTENNISDGSAWVTLLGPSGIYGYVPLSGNYSVLLESLGSPGTASISQTGTIPAGTQSLLFETQKGPTLPSGPLDVLIGPQTVPITEVGTGPNYILYGANISAWAGQTEQLTFSDTGSSGDWELDDISFSTTAVPEPSPLALAGIGAILFALCGRFVLKLT